MRDRPSVLVFTTTWWSSVAMLASSLEQVGFHVTVLCAMGHVAWFATRYDCMSLDRENPSRSLSEAIDQLDPTLVIPGDDRAVLHLRHLFAEGSASVRALIERSLGREDSFETLVSRVPLLNVARDVGMSIPDGGHVGSLTDLSRWLDRVPAPWVLKVDGAWGGLGVRVVQTRAQARAAFADLSRGVPLWMALKRQVVNGDPFWMQDRRSGRPIALSIQSFVRGRPGNCALFCRDGILLGATIVETEACTRDMGPSTLVRVVERPAFLDGARRLVSRLGLSGFLGLDFMIDESTGEPVLIEMNPRITAPCRIRTADGTDPISAAATAFGCTAPEADPVPPRVLFASFPLAWQTDPYDVRLFACQDDVPWHEPALVEEALKPLWPERGIVARLPKLFRSFRQALKTGRRPFDLYSKPFSWWLGEGLLRGPPRAETMRGVPQADVLVSHFDTNRTVFPNPL